MGVFSLKFSTVPRGKTTDQIKKVRGGAKMAHSSSITVPSMVGIVGCVPAVDKEVWCIFCLFFLSHFGMIKFVIMETLWSSVIFKTIMVSLDTGRFVVVHLYLTLSVNPQNFSLGANLYQKLTFFLQILGLQVYIFKATMVKFGVRVGTWDSLPQAKFCKNGLRGYTPFGQINTKKYQFWQFGGL